MTISLKVVTGLVAVGIFPGFASTDASMERRRAMTIPPLFILLSNEKCV